MVRRESPRDSGVRRPGNVLRRRRRHRQALAGGGVRGNVKNTTARIGSVGLAVVAMFLLGVSGCSESFDDCKTTRTCLDSDAGTSSPDAGIGASGSGGA